MTDPQAIQLNESIKKENANVLNMLSNKGKAIFFPKLGILAQAGQARGKEINATIGEARADNGSSMYLDGFDDFTNMDVAEIFPYAPSPGNIELRKVWKEFIYAKNPSLGNQLISQPIATNGLTHAISMAAFMFVDSSDTVIVSDLYWENYDLIFKNACEAQVGTFNLFKDGGFDIESFSNTIANAEGNKVVVLLNFPNNPTGYTPTIAEIDAIQASILKTAESGKDVVVLIDDAYFGLVYEQGIYTESIFTKLANLHEKVLAVKIDGPTKEDYVWGFRVGFLTYGIKNGTEELYSTLEAKTGGAVRGNISNISNLSQSLLLKMYKSEKYDQYKKEKYEILNSRYKTLQKALAENGAGKYFTALPYNSGYFMCVRVNEGLEAEKVRQLLLEKYSTGIIVFEDVIRLAFSAVPENKIEKLVKNIVAACAELA